MNRSTISYLPRTVAIWGWFLAYAASLAFTEAAERALVGDTAPQAHRATAYGLYHMIAGFAALPGAVLFGVLWQWAGEMVAFFTAAGLSLLSLIVLYLFSSSNTPDENLSNVQE